MSNFNKVILLGNLTRDPQLRSTPSGTSIAEFGLACNRKFKTPAGEEREEVTFVDVTAWGRQAEVINQCFTKGKPIFIEVRLKYDTWEDKNGGGKRSKLTVVIENFQFIGAPPAGQERKPAAYDDSDPHGEPALPPRIKPTMKPDKPQPEGDPIGDEPQFDPSFIPF